MHGFGQLVAEGGLLAERIRIVGQQGKGRRLRGRSEQGFELGFENSGGDILGLLLNRRGVAVFPAAFPWFFGGCRQLRVGGLEIAQDQVCFAELQAGRLSLLEPQPGAPGFGRFHHHGLGGDTLGLQAPIADVHLAYLGHAHYQFSFDPDAGARSDFYPGGGIDLQISFGSDGQVAVHPNFSHPGRRIGQGAGPARQGDGDFHGLAPAFHGQVQAAVSLAVAPADGGGRVGVRAEFAVEDAVEDVGRVAVVALAGTGIGRIVGPVVEIVAPLMRLGGQLGGGFVAGIRVQAVGAYQIDQFAVLVVVRRLLGADVPDEQPGGGQVAVVVPGRPLAVLQQQVLVVVLGGAAHIGGLEVRVQGDLEDVASLVQGSDRHGGVGVDFDPAVVVAADPAHEFAAPGGKRGGSVVAAPALGAVAHQAPPADTRPVVVRRRVGHQQIGLVVEIGQTEPVAEFVGHHGHGLGEGAGMQNRAAVGVSVDAHGIAAGGSVAGAEFADAVAAQVGDSGGLAHDEVGGHRTHENTHIVDQAVVVARIGHAVRPVVVEPSVVDVGVGFGEDLVDELRVPAPLSAPPGQIGGRRAIGGVITGQHLAVGLQLAEGHGVVEMGEAALVVRVE